PHPQCDPSHSFLRYKRVVLPRRGLIAKLFAVYDYVVMSKCKEKIPMFHRVSRSTSFETSHRRLGVLRWGIVAVLVLVAIGASTAALAAGPASASANVSHLALLKVVPKNVGI